MMRRTLLAQALVVVAAVGSYDNNGVNIIVTTTLCADRKCTQDCQTYETPFAKCYSAHKFFPRDPSWSEFDMRDDHLQYNNHGATEFARSIFASTNGTCAATITDNFLLPLGECIGPFGRPRPWGKLEIHQKDDARPQPPS